MRRRDRDDPPIGASDDAAGDAADAVPFGDEPFILPIEDVLDLHPFAPRDVASVTVEFLHAARAAGLRELRLVHGRGVGAQRQIVRSILARTSFVLAFSDAPAHQGGWGATLVTLARPGDDSNDDDDDDSDDDDCDDDDDDSDDDDAG